jgi:hypothetical protein
MEPIKPENLKNADPNFISETRISGLVTTINAGLLSSYVENDNSMFTYYSERVEELQPRERTKLKKIFEEAGYNVSFDSGTAYDTKPLEIVVKYKK